MTEPSPLPICFDATRLLSRAHFVTPTGIDRVDLAYAEALSAAPDIALQMVTLGSFGPRRLAPRAARSLVEDTARRWRRFEHRRTEVFATLSQWLASAPGTPPPVLPVDAAPGLRDRLARLRPLSGAGPLRPAPQAAALYVNTSHGRLFRPVLARWLERERLGGVFFVHDLIPIEHPAFNRAAEPDRHRARLHVVARHARSVIVNSEATRGALHDWLAAEGLRRPEMVSIPLGVAEAFAPAAPARPAPATPYFVVLGTIEPRKNHALLLDCWAAMAARGGTVPRLVVLGRRGWENEAVFRRLDRDAGLRPHVIEAAGLGDEELAMLLRGARALLAPSFAEGYGLPVAEALACGTPVLASDLPAHREVGGDFAEYLDPGDAPAWAAAIDDYAAPASARRAQRAARVEDYRAPRWPAHAQAALEVIRAAARSRHATAEH